MDLLSKTVDSLWQVIAVGLLLGAGLPAIFALGLRALDSGGTTDSTTTATRKPLAMIAAATCFAVVVVAIIAGILFVMQGFLSHTFNIEIF
ncbi:hypothetical protein [Rhodococcus sp. NPDC058514]|uniref:hypothetical protein n=1 Tax=unclassified Rhodococcus (in: high G+C Gram-positive bacteria) TaxID=192944 RepID=UPI00366260B4